MRCEDLGGSAFDKPLQVRFNNLSMYGSPFSFWETGATIYSMMSLIMFAHSSLHLHLVTECLLVLEHCRGLF